MKVIDIFSGIGGMSLGLEQAGMKTVAFCERGKVQQAILNRHWPHVRIFNDATKTDKIVRGTADDIAVIAGGDPCPIRSRARSNGDSKHPDLSGYFLALVARKRPRWVVRENVPAPDDCHFTAALELLGYRTVIIRADASALTGQSRQRDFIVGSSEETRHCMPRFLSHFDHGPGAYTTILGTRQIIPALTTHRTRYDSRDCYVYEQGGGLRILDRDERTAFAGFPEKWLDGLSEAACATVCGNAVVPAVSKIIGLAIASSEDFTPFS